MSGSIPPADKIRLIGERDRLCHLIADANLEILSIGYVNHPQVARGATLAYRAPDGREYEAIVRERP